MRENQLLLERYTGKSTPTHDGEIITLKSNLRWCSDSFEIRCRNGERVQVAFSLDCCDREAMRYVATTGAIDGELVRDLMAETLEHRFGAGAARAPHPIEWLSDNGPPYTAVETRAFGESLGFIVCTTPSYSPESNGMAEAFVKTFKRDYVYLQRLESAPSVIGQLPTWFDDYNEVHPHRGPRCARRASTSGAIQPARLSGLTGATPPGVAPVKPDSPSAPEGDLDIARQSLHSGADVNAEQTGEESVLHEAARSCGPDFVEALLAAGAKIDARRYDESTPVIMASHGGRVDVVRLLVEHGADVVGARPALNMGGPYDVCLTIAANAGHQALIAYLLERFQWPQTTLNVALGLAALSGWLEVCRMLVAHGADPFTPSGAKPESAYDRARAKKQAEVVAYFKELKAAGR
jgi:hypothetical protein